MRCVRVRENSYRTSRVPLPLLLLRGGAHQRREELRHRRRVAAGRGTAAAVGLAGAGAAGLRLVEVLQCSEVL